MNESELKVLFALPVIGHPRDSKRIAMLQQSGLQVKAVAFERKFHKGRMPSCPVETIGQIEHGRYFSRVLKMALAIPSIRRAMRSLGLVYASGLDMALLCLVAGLGLGRPVVLEIGDIRDIQTSKGFTGWLMRWVDKKVVDACSLLVATAPDFVDVYYRQWIGTNTPSVIIENKLDVGLRQLDHDGGSLQHPSDSSLNVGRIRIGYFGLLRWANSWETLRALAVACPDSVEIIIAGHVIEPNDLPRQIEAFANVEYRGEYKSPDDLPRLFNSVDLIWAVYPEIGPADWNLKWARTNRFYESCYFKKPIISRNGCKDAAEVRRLNIGLTQNPTT